MIISRKTNQNQIRIVSSYFVDNYRCVLSQTISPDSEIDELVAGATTILV